MPGPLPKELSVRQRTNKATSRAVLPPEIEPRQKPPTLPTHPGHPAQKWHRMTQVWWREVWQSPMAGEILRADEFALFMLAVLIDTFVKEPTVSLAAEIRQQQREFGLTPLNRRRLEWQVTQTEEAVEKHHRRRAKQATVIEDARGVLE